MKIASAVILAMSPFPAAAVTMRNDIPNQVTSINSNRYFNLANQGRFDSFGALISIDKPRFLATGDLDINSICSGVFISENTVGTAAHCFDVDGDGSRYLNIGDGLF